MDIYQWDPVNGTRAVCTEPIDQWDPAISGDTIVYTDNRNQATTGIDIYKWDPINGESRSAPNLVTNCFQQFQETRSYGLTS